LDAASGSISALNGSGRCPAALSLDIVGDRLEPFSAHTVTVPGAVRGWFDLRERHGSLDMAELLAPAIALARNGFAVGPVTAHHWALGAQSQLAKWPDAGALLASGRAPGPGEVFCNLDVARVLDDIARDGAGAFYGGATASAIAAAVQRAGGVLSEHDLAAHTSTWDEPISTEFRGVRIHECPPNGQGLCALIALDILSALPSTEPGSFARTHLAIEALRLAFADVLAYNADPLRARVPVEGLLDPAYIRRRAALIAMDRTAGAGAVAGKPAGGTVYLSTCDDRGNACSFIQSNYMGFGTGIVPDGCGFTLQNRGHNFSLDPAHPNALAPGKRPFHTIIPAMATLPDGSLAASFGVMGGFMQPQGHVQVAQALFEDHIDPQNALDRARFRVDPFSGKVALEDGFDPAIVAKLAAVGHPVHMVTGLQRSIFGRGQIICRDAGSGELRGGSDKRADGRVGAV
jgi:gamma-glutamyltranspeptidase/glutathione hydrolase